MSFVLIKYTLKNYAVKELVELKNYEITILLESLIILILLKK